MLTDKIFLGIDAGGTFTDFVALRVGEAVEVEVHKTLSTPDAPEQAILAGIEALGLSGEAERGALHIIHGSTVATNAALEGKNAPTAYVTNYGFGDTLTLGRQTRPALYSLEFPAQSIPVPSAYCLETGGRMSAEGKVLETLTSDELQDLVARIKDLAPEAVAINLLFSFLDDSSEVAIEKAIADAGVPVFVSRSSAVLPVYKEYERGIATWLNASLGPVVSGYLSRLRMSMNRCSLRIMQSNGETLDAEKAAESAVRLLLSGPAGGLIAMKTLGEQADVSNIISFDMGGTSTDVALLDGEIATTSEGHIGPYPVAVPMVDMHTIGAGGGSIAYVDQGGMLQVGPRSAGADPGPACYGLGGVTPQSRTRIWCWAGLFLAQDSQEVLRSAWRRPDMRSGLWRRKLRCPLKKRLPALSVLPMSTWLKQSGRSRLTGVMIRRILCWPVLVARVGFTFVLWQRRCACIRLWCPPGAVCSPPLAC